MTTLICDFQSIVGEKIEGYATLTAGKVRPSYSSPAVVVHEPIKQVVTDGQTTFENVNPGDAVITVEWADQTQSATIRFVVPDSEEAIYLADCLSADSLDPDEIELLRWGIRENLSGAREMLEEAKNLGLTEINGTVEAYFTEAAEILRKALEAAQLAEQSLGTIDSKVEATEGVVTDVAQAKQQIQALLDEIAALELELGSTNTDLAGAVGTINTLSPQISAAAQAASEATQKAQNAVTELSNVQTANAAEFTSIKQGLDSATQTAKQATDAVAQTNQQLGIEVQRILGEVNTALTTATEATAQARIANENLETYQYQLGEIHQEQGRILGQQAEIVGSFEHQLAEIARLSAEISTAATEIETISGEQSALVTEMNTQVGSLNELTAAQGAAINAAKAQADKGVTDAAAASNALTNYKKVNDPKVVAAQSTADTARAEATSKANAARIAAEGVAKELADKAQADAEVAAAAEALRIAQEEATAAKNAASADATAKANAAQSAAETLAKAQAKAAQEAAELTAAQDAATKAENARIAAEANAKVLSDKAQQAAAAAQTTANTGVSKADAAKARADKGVSDAATALAKANEANNKLPAITADVSAAAQTALDAVNALPGIRSEINVAKQQADRANELLKVQDTRNDDELPNYYWVNYSQTTATEFKRAESIGLTGGYGTLTTVVPWTDSSGGAIQQTFVDNNGGATYRRRSTGSREAATWTAWVNELAQLNSQIGALNTKAGELTTGLSKAATQEDYNQLNIRLWGGQGEINKLQSDINANNTAFQNWQREVNARRDIWEKASTDATAALARFAITQSQWNDISSKATNANTKAIASHAALFEGQQKWNEVAAAAIAAQATLLEKQDLWNQAQQRVNTNFQNWQNAATEMLTSTGKFQKLQNQFNSDQKKWNATQQLVNDSQKGINALNTKTDEAQTTAIQGLATAVRMAFPQINILTTTTNGSNVVLFGEGATHHSTERPTGANTSIHGTRSVGGVNGALPASTVANSTSVIQGLVYRFIWWTKFNSGTNEGLSLRVRPEPGSALSTSVIQRFSTDGGATWEDGNMIMCSPSKDGTWSRWEALIEFKPGTTTFTPAFATNGSSNQFQIYGLHTSAYFPVQEQIDKAQNDALAALNRFAINQSEWNTVSTTATNANTAALAAKKALDDNQNRWIQGADLAIANLQSTSAKYKQWTDGATTAIALNRELIGEQGLIQENQRLQMEELQKAVAEQTELLYEELKTKPEILIVGDGQSHYDSRITVNLEKSGSQVSKVTVRANGTWTGIMHVEADHGKSEGPGSTFMNYTPLLRKVNLSYATSRDIVLTRNTSVDHIGKVRITYWVYPGEVLTTQKTGSWLIVEKAQWLTLHSFTATDTATFNAELQVGWDAAGAGPEYGIRLTVNGTPVASDGPRKGVGPDFPWQDGYRQMSIKKTVVVQKGQTVKWEAYASYGSSNERRIRNFNARATYMYRGLTEN